MNDLEILERVRKAEELIANIPLDGEAAKSISSHWHHSAVLSNGDKVDGGKSLHLLKAEFSIAFDRLNLSGASVIDVGAWQGSFAFEAERRGASKVLAVDQICWFVDVFKGLETFLFLKKDKKSNVEYIAYPVDLTTEERLGQFDIVLFLGVFYHLQDPLSYLRELRKMTRQHLVLETHCDMLNDPLPAMRYYPGSELSGDGSNWWGPNPPCVEALLRNAGFSRVES